MATVLIVDDDPDVVEALTMVLEGDGWNVVSATRLHEAVQLARDHDPVLALVDYRLPEIDPAVLVQALRGVCRANVVLCTAADSPEALAEKTGADAVLAKPFSTQALLTVAQTSARRRHEAEPTVSP